MENISLSTNIGNFNLINPFMNAAGALCTTENHLINLNKSLSGALVSKSITLEPRNGNEHPKYFHNDFGSINSNGLENLGIDQYLEIYSKNNKWNKPLFFSVSGMCLDDNIQILKKINNLSSNTIVELNLSCPNVIGKPQIGYSMEDMETYIKSCCEIYNGTLGLKLPPYFDIIHFEQVANIIKKYLPNIKFITCCNSLGNGLIVDTDSESTVIYPKDGLGGIGGKYIKATSLANVYKFKKLLPNIDIIGCGGINTGEDAFQYLLCGATALQIGTQLMKEDTKCFERILLELKDIMFRKNYKCISEFHNKLKVKEKIPNNS